MRDAWRWWVVALLPRRVAWWIFWRAEWIPLGSWVPYVFGQSIGVTGRRG